MKKNSRPISVIVEKTNTGYSAFVEELNIFSTALSIPQLYENLLEALNLYFEEESREFTTADIQLKIDLQQFFKYYKVLNSKFLANRIGMNPTLLSQYVSGVKKPSQKQNQKIIDGIQMIGKELAELSLVL